MLKTTTHEPPRRARFSAKARRARALLTLWLLSAADAAAAQPELLTPSAWRASALEPGGASLDPEELLVPVEWRASAACGTLLQPGVICALDPELMVPADWTGPR